MKRRDFGLLAGTSIATAAALRPAKAQSTAPDATLLTTTLTPYGAERAGNADGSIPAWTGGWVKPPVPANTPIDEPFYGDDEQKLYTVDASNLAQYQALVAPGLSELITKYGYSLNVYPTHRTAAAPQYVYDNIAKNVTRAKLDPRGGRLGFTGGYGGIPFPIIDTADPYVGGVQLIWNHLTAWGGFSNKAHCAVAVVVIGGKATLSGAQVGEFLYPYYDPNGSPETYQGFYSKLHIKDIAPANVDGQELIVWHSTNINVTPDITWELLNGQGRVRKAPNENYDTPNSSYDGISNIDESQCFYGNPSQYDWKYLGKQEMLIPYNCNALRYQDAFAFAGPRAPDPSKTRWEKHRVWVIEATLHPGILNVLSRRRFYLDEDTYNAVLGESYDRDDNMVKTYISYIKTSPSVPQNNPVNILTFNLMTGDYVFNGNIALAGYQGGVFDVPPDSSYFDPQVMAANASF